MQAMIHKSLLASVAIGGLFMTVASGVVNAVPIVDIVDPELDIEVSILTEPLPLAYRDSQDLIRKLRVNVDGVIIRKGHASATFLPQVWEQLPRPENFLNHLCMKAGLPADAWKHSELEVLTYQVQYFEEKH